MCDKKAFPFPLPSAAPATRPAISTNSIAVGTIFADLAISAIFKSR